MFERIEVLGTKEAIVHPTPEAEAHGWRELWGDAVLSADHGGRYGRGERSQDDDIDRAAARRVTTIPATKA